MKPEIRTDKDLHDYYRGLIQDVVKLPIVINDGELAENLWDSNKDGDVFHFRIAPEGDRNKAIATFNLSKMPGSNDTLISNDAFISPEHRKKGLGTILNAMRIDIAKRLFFRALICTNSLSNEPQRKILTKNGWQDAFVIGEQGKHQVALSYIVL